METVSLVRYLDDYLAIKEIPDWKEAYNGLQVEGRERTTRIALAVDACRFTLTAAARQNADLMIVHHGLFWGATAPVVGAYHRRLSELLKNDIALYSCHTPLDAHPEVGNNAVLTRLLGLSVAGWWAEKDGVPLATFSDTELSLETLVERVSGVLEVEPKVIATGPNTVRRIGVLTGAGGGYLAKASALGIDTLLTGEGPHHSYFDAEELGLNLIYAGHYATETVGVKALGEHLRDRFGLDAFFIDHPTGL